MNLILFILLDAFVASSAIRKEDKWRHWWNMAKNGLLRIEVVVDPALDGEVFRVSDSNSTIVAINKLRHRKFNLQLRSANGSHLNVKFASMPQNDARNITLRLDFFGDLVVREHCHTLAHVRRTDMDIIDDSQLLFTFANNSLLKQFNIGVENPEIVCRAESVIAVPLIGLNITQCVIGSEIISDGDEFRRRDCEVCKCDQGNIMCQYEDVLCEELACHVRDQYVPRGACCPECRVKNANCGQSNCTQEQQCVNGICVCREGFMPNGNGCADVNECAFALEARQQMHTCGDGTECTNTYGGYRCDCRPGFQRLDERNCEFFMRI